MRILLQRVSSASVKVEGEIVGEIGQGVLLLVGLGEGDDETKLSTAAEKIANLRIFSDEQKRFHLSLLDIKGAALMVSQFTLYADTAKGRRPDFFGALKPELAEPLCEKFIAALKAQGIQNVQSGRFGAYMQVALENDGPVTIMLEF